MDEVVVLVSKPPYGTSLAAEAFRYAIGLASMDIRTTMALVEDGVFCVSKGQDPRQLDMKPLGLSFAGLGEFGVRLVVLGEAAAERGLGQEDLIAGETVSLAQLASLLEQAGAVVRF